MNDFKKEYKFLKAEIDKAVLNTMASGWYILGKEVEKFETDFAKYIRTKYCIGVANGLEALQISLMALGICPGNEIITVSNSAVATALAITNIGAKPVFIDINDYYLMDVQKIKDVITPKTRAIIPVHLFGQMTDMTTVKKIANKHNLKIVEDACQAHGATQNSKKAGSIGNLGCFSFYPTKNLGDYGDGGAITTNSKELYEKCKMLRNYGQKNRYEHQIRGINSRLDEIQATILNVKLKKLDEFVKKRNEIAKIYYRKLAQLPQISLPKISKNSYHSFHLFVIQAEKRNDLQKFLSDYGIQTLIHYPIPIHKQECYHQYKQIKLKKTENFAKEILSLPLHPFLSKVEVIKICNIIHKFYAQKNCY